VVVLTDGRRYRGRLVRRSGVLRVEGDLRVVTAPLGHLDRVEEEPARDAAPFARLGGPVGAVDPDGPRVDPRARPVGGGRISPEGELTRTLHHPDVGTFPVRYRITELRPRWYLLEGVDRPHRVRLTTATAPAGLLHRLRARDLEPDDGAGWLEMARFGRLAGWLDRAARDLERAAADPAVDADALAAERAALAGARARAAAVAARAALDRHDVAAAEELLEPVREDLDARGRALADAVAERTAALRTARERFETLAVQAESLGEPALAGRVRAEGSGLSAAQARAVAALEPPDEPLAAAAARLRAARRYGPFLAPEALAALDLEALAAAEALLAALAAADPAGRSDLLARDLPPLEERLAYPVWEALVRGGAGRTAAPATPPRGRLEAPLPPGEAGDPAAYGLFVPPSVVPGRPAPLLVALHGQGEPLESMLAGWRGFAERHGLLLASVEYAVHAEVGYHHSWPEHRAVLAAVRDVARRYPVDPDRVFVTGHSMGGHAAWDLALSHPLRFAGAVPVIGSHFAFGERYRENAAATAIYCVDGEHDFAWPERNRDHTVAMQREGWDVTYSEYPTRGHEGFGEERPWLAVWLRARRRDPDRPELDQRIGRATDARRGWLRIDRFAIDLPEHAPTGRVGRDAVARVRAEVRDRDEVRLDVRGAAALTVFLSDRLLDLDGEVTVRLGRRVVFRGRVARSAGHMLRDWLAHGDRGLLYPASVAVQVE